jgi:hypothetical protein
VWDTPAAFVTIWIDSEDDIRKLEDYNMMEEDHHMLDEDNNMMDTDNNTMGNHCIMRDKNNNMRGKDYQILDNKDSV